MIKYLAVLFFACVCTAYGSYERLSPENAAVLLVDHQTGLAQLVRDWGVAEFKQNVLALAEIAKAYNMETVIASSLEDGPNGPIWPEIIDLLPDAANIPRAGEINAWDNAEFVDAVKATGKKKLIVAGIVTDVCVSFVTLSAIEAGFEVYVVVDASGTFNEAVRDAAITRMVAAGAVPVNIFAVACELQLDWRDDGDRLKEIALKYIPEYGNLIISDEGIKTTSR